MPGRFAEVFVKEAASRYPDCRPPDNWHPNRSRETAEVFPTGELRAETHRMNRRLTFVFATLTDRAILRLNS